MPIDLNQAMLYESSEKAHQLVALGLLARVFYASEPLGECPSHVTYFGFAISPSLRAQDYRCQAVLCTKYFVKAADFASLALEHNVDTKRRLHVSGYGFRPFLGAFAEERFYT